MIEVHDIRRHLLGSLDPESMENLENRLISEDASEETTEEGSLEELLLAVEDELIDDFVRDRLNPEDHERFCKHFLCTPERRQKLLFSTAFRRHVDSTAVPEASVEVKSKPDVKRWFNRLWHWSPAPTWSYAHAAVLVLAVIGCAWMLAGKLRLEGKLDQVTADRVALEEQLASLRDAARAPIAASASIATVWLAPGLIRGPGEVERVIIPADAGLVRVQLDLGVDDYDSYRAALHGATGDELWTQSKLQASENGERVAVTVTLPSELVPRGDYYFRLSGVSSSGDLELVGRYHFRALEERGPH